MGDISFRFVPPSSSPQKEGTEKEEEEEGGPEGNNGDGDGAEKNDGDGGGDDNENSEISTASVTTTSEGLLVPASNTTSVEGASLVPSTTFSVKAVEKYDVLSDTTLQSFPSSTHAAAASDMSGVTRLMVSLCCIGKAVMYCCCVSLRASVSVLLSILVANSLSNSLGLRLLGRHRLPAQH